VTLTEQGIAILPYAQRLLNVAQGTFDDMQQIMAQGGDGTLRIGLIPSVSTLLFPAVPQLLAQHFPNLRVEFHDQTNDSLLVELDNGSLDFGIGALDSTVPDSLEIHPLCEDPFVVVMRKDDKLAQEYHLPWKLLANRPIAVFLKGNLNRLVNSLIESHNLNITINYRVDFIETLYGLVRSRLALAILPEFYTATLNDDELKVVHLQQPEVSRTLAMMRKPSTQYSIQTEKCFQLLLQEFHRRVK